MSWHGYVFATLFICLMGAHDEIERAKEKNSCSHSEKVIQRTEKESLRLQAAKMIFFWVLNMLLEVL